MEAAPGSCLAQRLWQAQGYHEQMYLLHKELLPGWDLSSWQVALCFYKHSLLPQHPHKLFGKVAQDLDGQRLQESWLALPWQDHASKEAHFNQDGKQERGDGRCWEGTKRQISAQAQGGGQCWQMGDNWVN